MTAISTKLQIWFTSFLQVFKITENLEIWAWSDVTNTSMVKITVSHWLKPTESQELPTKKVLENPMITNHFIIFYCSMKIDWLCFLSLKSYRYFCSSSSISVLILSVFRHLLLRNWKISSKSLFWNKWTQHADRRWQQESYFTSTLINCSIIYLQIGIIFQLNYYQ